MSYVPATVNLTSSDRILQGATYYREFALTVSGVAVDLTGWTGARCQFRETAASGTVVVTPVMTIVSPPTLGKIGLELTSTVTTAMGTPDGGVFDIEIYDSAVPPVVERVIQGSWSIEAEVTR